jgi:hypothetical protein
MCCHSEVVWEIWSSGMSISMSCMSEKLSTSRWIARPHDKILQYDKIFDQRLCMRMSGILQSVSNWLVMQISCGPAQVPPTVSPTDLGSKNGVFRAVQGAYCLGSTNVFHMQSSISQGNALVWIGFCH